VTAGNLELIDELVADDISDHAEGLPGQPSGKEGVKFFVTTLRDAFPDIRATVGTTPADRNLAAGEATLTGTHQGECMSVPASNKPIEVDSVDIIRVEEGRSPSTGVSPTR
jgi:SnoaL-like polyketide cyclase